MSEPTMLRQLWDEYGRTEFLAREAFPHLGDVDSKRECLKLFMAGQLTEKKSGYRDKYRHYHINSTGEQNLDTDPQFY